MARQFTIGTDGKPVVVDAPRRAKAKPSAPRLLSAADVEKMVPDAPPAAPKAIAAPAVTVLPPEPVYTAITPARREVPTSVPMAMPQAENKVAEVLTPVGARTGLLDHSEVIDAILEETFPAFEGVRKGRTGRPNEYRRDIADTVLILSAMKTLDKVCANVNLPSSTLVRVWILDNVDGFAERYLRARRLFLDKMVDDVLDIVDDETGDAAKSHVKVQRDRIRVESRQWMLSKLSREVFGNPVEADPAKRGGSKGPNDGKAGDARNKLRDLVDRAATRRATAGSSQSTH